MFNFLTKKFKKTPPPAPMRNNVKNALMRRWPMYAGGFGGRGVQSKRYGALANSHGVPLTVRYKPPNKGLNNTRNIKNLEVNVPYLFVIQVDRSGNFETRFVKTEGRVEIKARHAYLANLSNVHSKVVAASGEIKVLPSGRVVFNLESGTFMVPLKSWYKNTLPNTLSNSEKNTKFNKNYPNFVKRVMKLPSNSNFTKNILINQTNMPLSEIMKRAKNTPGITLRGYMTKPRHKLPNLSYNNWVKEAAGGRKTRSKGPVRPNMRIR
jgi:hypothetical protein